MKVQQEDIDGKQYVVRDEEEIKNQEKERKAKKVRDLKKEITQLREN